MKIQGEEEMIHVWKIYDYIFSRGGRPVFREIKKPKGEYESIRAIFESGLKHERYITSSVEKLVVLARSENDLATESLLQWYIDEQVEEENNFQTILDRLEQTEGNSGALYLLDQELGKRIVPQNPNKTQTN